MLAIKSTAISASHPLCFGNTHHSQWTLV
jgi:ribonuclease HI